MAQTHKVLGQVNPNATTATNLYVCPANTSAIVSSLTIANVSNVAVTYRLSVRPGGANQTNAMYLAYDSALPANDTTILTSGLTLAASDVVTCYASTGNVAFGAFGVELT